MSTTTTNGHFISKGPGALKIGDSLPDCSEVPRTRIHYDYHQPHVVEAYHPDFLNRDNPYSLKGVVYSLRYLPRNRVWLARAVLANTVVHAQAAQLVSDTKRWDFATPANMSHEVGGIFSLGSGESGEAEVITTLHGLRKGAEEIHRQRTISVIEALARRFAAVTLDTLDGIVAEEFDPELPTMDVDSSGPFSLPPDSFRAISSYGREIPTKPSDAN